MAVQRSRCIRLPSLDIRLPVLMKHIEIQQLPRSIQLTIAWISRRDGASRRHRPQQSSVLILLERLTDLARLSCNSILLVDGDLIL